MAANPGQFPPSKTGNKTASANNNITTTNRQRAPLQPVKRHSAQGAYYYDESKDDSSVSCSVMSAVNEKASAPFGTLPISKANNKGECNKLVEAPIDITNWKAESVTDKSLPKPTRPVYYDATYDDVPKSLEKSSSVTVSSEKHSISATASEKALARKLRRRELRSMKTAREATTESEATGSESTSEESQHDALLLRANSHNKAYQNHGTLKPVHCGVGSSSVVANKLVSSICAATTKPKSKTTTNALPTTKTNKDVTVAVLEKQPPKQYNRAVDGEQRCVACEGAEKFFKKMLNKSAAEIALKGEHKTLVKKARHISEFCKSLSDEGRNRYAHMVNFNECALRLEPTVPGDVKYIHASRIRHAYGNFILAQGPTRRTLVDFYRLVWLNRIRLIVCVDPLVNPRNCVHYFEFNVSKTFKVGKRFTVLTCKATTTETSNLTIYELYMSNKELKSGATGRRIILLHYNAWEVLKPPTARTLLEIIKCVRTLETPSRGSLHPDPILVHGSCGVRRSGILALTSILCNQVSLTQKLSIVRTAIEIRRIRYGVLRSRLGFLIVLEAVLLHASTIGVLDPRAKVRDALAIIRRERCKIEGENRQNLHTEFD